MSNPICPIHKTEMRPSKYKEGEFFCGKKTEGGSYCKEKAAGNAPPSSLIPPPPGTQETPPGKEGLPHKAENTYTQMLIARQVALKAAVELVAAGKAETKDLLPIAEKLTNWINGG